MTRQRLGRYDRIGLTLTTLAITLTTLGWWIRHIDKVLNKTAGDE